MNCKNLQTIKRNEVIREKVWETDGQSERLGHQEEDDDYLQWEKEVDRVMKQRNLTYDDAVNWQLWQLTTSNQQTTGKQTDQTGRQADRQDKYIHIDSQLVCTVILALQILSDVMETIMNVGCRHRWYFNLQADLQHMATVYGNVNPFQR